MISIRYPGSVQGADLSGIERGLGGLADGLENRKNRKLDESAYERYLASVSGQGGQQPMSIAALAPQQQPVDAATQRVAQSFGDAPGPTNGYFSAIRSAESGGNDAAKNPNSSATGRYQFTKGTWNGLDQQYPDLGLTPDGRTDPNQQERAIKVFTRDNAKQLSQGGVPVNPTTLYAAHFLGAGGARNALTQPDQTPMASVVGPEVVQANPFLAEMTVGDFKGWAAQKAGGASQGGQSAPAPQGQPAPQAAPQGGSLLPDRETMLAMFRSPTMRPLAISLVQAAQKKSAGDPMADIEYRKALIELRNLENPQPNPTDDMREYDLARQQGFTGSILDFQVAQKKAGATNVTTNVGEGDKFFENLDKKNAETFGALSETGVQARSKLAQIGRLEGLLANAPQGAVGGLKQAIGEFGINTEGLDDIQSAQALINELVPQQRQPGSGPMSDADLALFKQSLPRVINQQGGNQVIIDTMRGIAEYQVKMGEIADSVADREMTPKEGREAIRNLENPLANFAKVNGGAQSGNSAPATPKTDEEYNVLPSGAPFIDPDDGKTYRKP